MAQLSDAPAGSTDPKRVAPFTEKGHPTSAKARWVAPYLRRYLSTIEEALGVRFQRRSGRITCTRWPAGPNKCAA